MWLFDLYVKFVVFWISYALRLHDFIKIKFTEKLRPLVPGVRVEYIKIPSRDEGRFIPALRYTPEGATGALPVHVSFQASGWVLMRLGLDRYMLSLFSKRMNAAVIDVAYRRAPWDRFPSAQDDCVDATAYVFANPSLYDSSRVTLGGSSAGGCMALVTAATFGPSKIKGVFSLYPVTRIESYAGMKKHKVQLNKKFYSGIVIPPWMMSFFVLAYGNGNDAELNDARFSPFKESVYKFPEHILLACGDADTLYDDGKVLIEKIHREGSEGQKRNTEFLSIPDEAHEFNNFPQSPHSVEWRDKLYDAAIAKLQAAWARP
ncbi:hypothetical protein MBRA1_002776 [Malassezia brasiliensis]|uniref:Alpha/beta hydrolase fold-3 domain-containing protein n=1 Tax=Malassezia brasiliensis TaxID=1821822 RepID=A0AAF0IQH3_9BASI|nr:hypothetical protein MBRA1_002776 [Malassezia brasiliensis]